MGPGSGRDDGGALGDPTLFDNPRQVYRTAGLNPRQYESAGKRRDSVISREGSVELRRAQTLGTCMILDTAPPKRAPADTRLLETWGPSQNIPGRSGEAEVIPPSTVKH